MSRIGKYIYGIVNSNALAEEKVSTKVGGVTTCEQVYTIAYQDISAVVSDSEVVDYTHMLKDAVARHLLRHQKVIEEIMPKHTVIPMKLGTYACDETEVRDILNKGYRIIKNIFAKISDKIEIDVTCIWSDFNSVLKEVGEEKEIKEFKQRLLSRPKGITVEDQMKVGVMVKKALDKRREKCVFDIQDGLKTASCEFRDHELMDDKMIANFAFLIEKSKRENFDRKVEELNTEFHDELNFRCVGPLPPYSFYTLQIKKMDFKEIYWARKKLGLTDSVARDELKRAHQRLAISMHPDRNPDISGIERKFDDVSKAYKILQDFCQASEQTVQKESFSFNEEEFKKNSILVKLQE